MSVFKDKTAIVTGGASGMGEAVCRQLAARGASVIVADIQSEKAEKVAAEIRAAGGMARAAALDVSDREAVFALVENTARESGRLDYMFNNAGMLFVGEVRDMAPAQWEKIVRINTMGVLHGTLAAYNVMIRQGSGHIVNTASMAGLIYQPITVAYVMTKQAVVGLSLSLRIEAAGLGVRVSAVCPGVVKTPLYDHSPSERASIPDVMGILPVRACPAEKAADHILAGVTKNKALILFPLHARMLWLAYRLMPLALVKFMQAPVWYFRKKLRK
ncbi:MAG: SDR family oxidoreductase [Thermodesulfobacteriota bacterium]